MRLRTVQRLFPAGWGFDPLKKLVKLISTQLRDGFFYLLYAHVIILPDLLLVPT